MTATLHIAPLQRPAIGSVLELLKPVTWFAPMWAFSCGLVSAHANGHTPWIAVAAGVLLCGPLVTGTSQAVNDWYDRHVDAINEPNRPIPSGRIPGQWGLGIAVGWTILSLLVAACLGPFVFAASLVGMAAAWAYSAPPLRLKRNGWMGNTAVAACYEGLPWVTGAALLGGGGVPDWHIIAIAGLYSFGAHGIMTLNDFKSIPGDRAMGIDSLPAIFGEKVAALLACMVMAAPQVVVITLMMIWGHPAYAGGVTLLLAAQFALMPRLLANPCKQAPWYNATGTTLYVLGMLVSAFALHAGVVG